MIDDRARFLEPLTDDELENSGGVVLEEAAWGESDLRLRLRMHRGDSAPAQHWNVHVGRRYRESLCREWAEQVYLGREHPVLVPYTQKEADIFFTGNEVSAREMLAVVSMACESELEGWHGPADFLNERLGLLVGRCGPHGLLGRFPMPVATRIVQELADAPIRAVVLNERFPSYWNGVVRYSEAAEALVFGSSFVVGEGIRVDAA